MSSLIVHAFALGVACTCDFHTLQIGRATLTITFEPLREEAPLVMPESSRAREILPANLETSQQKSIRKQKRDLESLHSDSPKREKERDVIEPTSSDQKPQYTSEEVHSSRHIHQAEYLNNPPPEYPELARRRHQEGTVTLLVTIDAHGSVVSLSLDKSSGYAALDRAAQEAVSSWHFAPATLDHRQVTSKVIVPIVFSLQR